jgi:ATP-binding cassette subfamily B protein
LFEIYWRALRYLGAEKRYVVVICAANIVLAMVTVAEPVLFGKVIDAVASERAILPTVGVWASFGAFNIVAFVLVARQADRLAHKRRLEVLSDSFERVIAFPLSWHQARGTSNALHTLLRALDTLFSLWLEFLRQHLSTATALVLLIPTALALDLRLSLVLLALGAAYVAIDRLVMNKTTEGQRAVEGHHHCVFAHVSDSIGNVAVLQSYNRIEHEAHALKEHAQRLIAAQYPVLDWWALASALHRLASTVSMIVVLLVGALLVSRGELRVGDIVAFIGFANLLIGRLDQITAFVNQIFEARVKLEEFYRFEDVTEDDDEAAAGRELTSVAGHIRFENVSFAFPGSGHGLRDISFDVQPGQTVAIVGPTGAGKTTLINLLQRVYDPTSGRILVDGIDSREVTRHSLRRNIAAVFQDPGLFNRTIEENIRIGRDESSSDDIRAAALAASAHDFILSKIDGYDTVVGDRGAQLSGGERQRIAIARAILKDAPILVLDEATSALDVETEARVKKAVDELRQNRTTFVIAHRLTTVRDADLVLFLDRGCLVEAGSFDDLAAKSGRFAALLRAGELLHDDKRRIRLVQQASEAA